MASAALENNGEIMAACGVIMKNGISLMAENKNNENSIITQ